MGLRRTLRAALLTALAAAALACVAPAALAQAPAPSFFGMQALTFPGTADLEMISRGGVGSVRVSFNSALGTRKASWEPYDKLMTTAAQQRIEVLPVMTGIAGVGPRIHRPRTQAQRIAWGRFARAVARRYGRGGTFWRDHPELPVRPLTAYQVWNEPNLPAYWRPATDAAGYLRLVRLTRARLRAVDPQATIVLAGLPESRLGTPLLTYIRSIYAVRGARALFDVVALNPYSNDARGVLKALGAVRSYMDRRGDRATPIWITELGWATRGPRSPFRTTKAGQAARVVRALRALLAARGRLRLERVMWFSLQDRPYTATERPGWGPWTGLFDIAGRPKPAWRAFVGFTGGQSGGRLHRVGRHRQGGRLP